MKKYLNQIQKQNGSAKTADTSLLQKQLQQNVQYVTTHKLTSTLEQPTGKNLVSIIENSRAFPRECSFFLFLFSIS